MKRFFKCTVAIALLKVARTFVFLIAICTLNSAAVTLPSFVLSADKRSVEKVDGKKVLTRFEVISKCGVPSVGSPEIRSLRVDSSKVHVVFGKHSFAEIDVASSKLKCLGSD